MMFQAKVILPSLTIWGCDANLSFRRQQKTRLGGFNYGQKLIYSPDVDACPFLERFSAFFSAGVFNGFFFAFFLLSIPLLMMASWLTYGWVACRTINPLAAIICKQQRVWKRQRLVYPMIIYY
jgi:hypothetical protein